MYKFDLPIREEPFKELALRSKKRAYGKHLYLPVLSVNQEALILAGTMKVRSISNFFVLARI
jgi:hypothetical protein